MMQQYKKFPALAPTQGPSIGRAPQPSRAGNSARNAAVSPELEGPSFLDAFAGKDYLSDWNLGGKKAAGDGVSKVAGGLRVATALENAKGLKGPLRALGGMGRIAKLAASEQEEPSISGLASVLRGGLEFGAGVQETLPLINSSWEAAQKVPGLSALLGGAKAVDAFANIGDEEGMSMMNGLDFAQGTLSATGALLMPAKANSLSAMMAVKGGALTAGGSLLGAGLAGFKLGETIAEHTPADEVLGDSMTAVDQGLFGGGAAEVLGGGVLEAGAKWASGEANFLEAVDGTMGAGTLADAFGWLPGT